LGFGSELLYMVNKNWINLPFKVHNSEGRIVAEKRVNPKEEARDPIGWNQVASKAE